MKLGDKGYKMDSEKLHAVLLPSLKEIAWMAAYEIVERHPQVLAVLLYGSIAKGQSH